MSSFLQSKRLFSFQRRFSALLSPKFSPQLMASTLMAILGLLTLSNDAKALDNNDTIATPVEDLTIIDEVLVDPVPLLPPIIDPDNGWERWPGWWSPRSLYFSFNPTTKAIQTFTDANVIPGGEAALGLAKGNNGLYYGVNTWGGTEGYGDIYSLNPADNRQEELVSFSPSSDPNNFLYGAFPSNLTLGNNGSFYGTTSYGGEHNGGSIFMFNPDGNTLETVANFENSYEDEYGYAYSGLPSALTLGQDGFLYGTTSYGGEHKGGSVFSFDPINNKLSTAFSFDLLQEEGIDYSYSYSMAPSALTLANNGLLYGITAAGGEYNGGTLFSFDPSQGDVTIMANFEPFFDANGYEYFPSPSSLTLGNDGILYGTTSGGGDGNFGTIFSFDPNSNSLSTAANFDLLEDV